MIHAYIGTIGCQKLYDRKDLYLNPNAFFEKKEIIFCYFLNLNVFTATTPDAV